MQKSQPTDSRSRRSPLHGWPLNILVSGLALSLLVGCHRAVSKDDEEKSQPSVQRQENIQLGPAQLPQFSPAVPMHDAVLPAMERPLAKRLSESEQGGLVFAGPVSDSRYIPFQPMNTESYSAPHEHGFINTANDQLSTFAIDVDTASYANIRRFLNGGLLPPVGAVRIEEMINYFDYSLPAPQTEPFLLSSELGSAPWNKDHQLLKISLTAKEAEAKDLVPSNLVFLIDVSGSMNQPNKLPLLQKSLRMLVEQLGADDRVSIVTYAGSDRVVLPPTAGADQTKIIKAIDNLVSGGSTHASAGIHTAYQLAEQVFMPGGNNRVILASDGDFNVGVTSRGELQGLISNKKEHGIFLTVLGFGMGNYADDTMELLADSGNGNYAYIDSLLEAKKVLIKERASTLFTLARDVKLQVEFNPEVVGAYRLLGYENRLLADEEFNDDSKDAGEVGLGHTVTALYELIPADGRALPDVDPLKYGSKMGKQKSAGLYAGEAATIKLRYILPHSTSSVKKELVVKYQPQPLAATSDDFRFSAAVAGFGMLLKKSAYAGDTSYDQLLQLARNARGTDAEGYRAEFVRLLEMASLIQPAG